VQKLKSYESNDKFQIESDLQIKGSDLYVEFKISDAQNLFKFPIKNETWTASTVKRENGLWQATCFEMFLMPEGSKRYYEFNFSLKPAWNAYQFETYRHPQPPAPTGDFNFRTMSWDPVGNILKVALNNKSSYRQFHVGLTAILVEKSGAKHYCALTHLGERPDFHIAKSFNLIRGST
jgi:hypothetical protein